MLDWLLSGCSPATAAAVLGAASVGAGAAATIGTAAATAVLGAAGVGDDSTCAIGGAADPTAAAAVIVGWRATGRGGAVVAAQLKFDMAAAVVLMGSVRCTWNKLVAKGGLYETSSGTVISTSMSA